MHSAASNAFSRNGRGVTSAQHIAIPRAAAMRASAVEKSQPSPAWARGPAHDAARGARFLPLPAPKSPTTLPLGTRAKKAATRGHAL